MAIHAVGRNEAQPVLIRPRLIGSCNESQQAAEHSRAKGSPTGRDGLVPPGEIGCQQKLIHFYLSACRAQGQGSGTNGEARESWAP